MMRALRIVIPAAEVRVGDEVEVGGHTRGVVGSIRDHRQCISFDLGGTTTLVHRDDKVVVTLEDEG